MLGDGVHLCAGDGEMSTHIQNLIRRARMVSDERDNVNITYPSRVAASQIRALISELADALVGYQIGAADCKICGFRVEPEDQAWHLKTQHAGPHIFYHDGRQYSTERPSMTVKELKHLVLCTPNYPIYEERDYKDIFHSDGVSVDLTRKPHFYSVPPATY